MRVLFLTHSYPRWMGDAAGSFLLRLATALGDRDVQVRVLAPNAAGLARDEVIGGIPVHRFRYAPRTWETLAYTGTMAEDARASLKGGAALGGLLAGGLAAALRLQREWSPDVIHAHWWFPAGIVGSASAAMTGRPLLVTMHGSDVRFAHAIRAARPVFRCVLASAAVSTTVSGWLARQAQSAGAAHAVVAPMPAATDLFFPNEAPRDPARVLFVGRLNDQKGIMRLVEAAASLPTRTTIDVVGEGPLGRHARDQADRLGLGDRIRWLGALPQHQLPELYRQAAVLAVPSLDEGLGLAAVEAQLCGTPVVAFDSGGIAETLLDGVTGRLVPAGDVAAFAAALESILADPRATRTMGDAGVSWAQSRFAPDAVAAAYARLYSVAAAA